MQYIDNSGLFLVSNSSDFGFGFNTNADITSFTVVIQHIASSRIIWSANRGVPVGNSDNFVFDADGNAYIESKERVIWSTNTSHKGVSTMELLDTGNLVLVGNDGGGVWQSFDHPTDTLMPDQDFKEGMKLVSNPRNNLTFWLEIKSGDLILSAGYKNPQPYWAMWKDKRRIINKEGGNLNSATIEANSWRFFDQSKVLLGQFVFADGADSNTTWAAVLDDDGFIRFYNIPGKTTGSIEIPGDSCSTPQSCWPYFVCHSGKTCQCPSGLNEINCKPSPVSCGTDQKTLINAGESLSYLALGFVAPSSKTSLEGCKSSCLSNCSCLVMFFDGKSGNCYMFDQIGSFVNSDNGASFESYVKVSRALHGKKKESMVVVIAIVIATVFVIISLVFVGVRLYKKKKNKDPDENGDEASEEDNFLETLSGVPVRFSYLDLQRATDNFSKKLGQGGFGSVYEGVLKDGTRLAVKQLEGIGQGKKEFRAESDVYSFGMVLLEIIGGRKNYDSSMISEKSHFPSYAFKMMEEGNIQDVFDPQMKIDERDERVIVAIKVALWCIQDDMNLRPPMTKVVQMLEGLSPVPQPPMASQTGSRLYSGLFKSESEEGTSSGPSDCNSDAYLSAVRLSGPR
ncbi:hypothetical protein L1987_80797 [Smallanthus sonchifolius]|uniref:Uncharacterized protein n=1 Tax=Smallanthus sonchifolius TaxID=185202 RepID=A0ACB8YPD5_9ASTR|nr:hypothetical protein L1987_80797 [Smallanthus sonchifolius]